MFRKMFWLCVFARMPLCSYSTPLLGFTYDT